MCQCGPHTEVPGTQACHKWITDECRANGDDQAMEQALGYARRAMERVLDGWPVGKGVRIHVAVTVERPR